MTNILWADDQSDVIKTFSSLLSPLSPEIVSVDTGNKALEKLNIQYFDILILDLMMPPDKWGGLWLLEEIRKANIRIPIIILSGEGTQNETIKALRLGAKDYVTKDAIEVELLQRVKVLLENAEKEIEEDIQNSTPTPLAFPYKKYLYADSSVLRLHYLIEFYEACLRFVSIVGICELKSNGESLNTHKSIMSLLSRPSMGAWNQIRQTLRKYLTSETDFEHLSGLFDEKKVASIVQIRNDIMHGTEPTEPLALSELKKLEANLHIVVGLLWQKLQFELILPIKMRFDGNMFIVEGHILRGDISTPAIFQASISGPLICDQPYFKMKQSNRWINLFPYMCIEPSVEPPNWKVFLFDGFTKDANLRYSGEEQIRYIEILSGQRNLIPDSKPKLKLFPEIMNGLG